MNGKFFDLSKEKQDRMINGILKVFALNGYRHASTDDIVREAGISKGLLFHYFESKLGAYIFAYDYSVKFMTLELSTLHIEDKNFFDTVKLIEKARMNALFGYPYMQQFLNRAELEDVKEALFAIEDKRNALNDVYSAIWAKVDWNGFPASVDKEKFYNTVKLAISGLMSERIFEAAFQPEMFYNEACEYIDNLKWGRS